MKNMKAYFRLLIFSLLIPLFTPVKAQQKPELSGYKSIEAKLERWTKYCNDLVDANNYPLLIIAAKQGTGLCSHTNNYRKMSQFAYFTGYGYEYSNNQYEKAIVYYEQANAYALKAHSLKDEVNALMRLNYMYYSVRKFSKRDTLIQYIKAIADTTKDVYSQAILNGSIGEYYLDLSQYERFISYKLKAIDYRKKMLSDDDGSNRDNIGISYLQIVGAYLKMKQMEKVLEYLDYSKGYLKNSREGEAFMYNDYIVAYLSMNKPDSAQQYFRRLYSKMGEADSLYINLSYANRSFADYFLTNKKKDQALQYARNALRFAGKSEDDEILMEANTAMGKVKFEQGDFKQAIVFLEAASVKAYHFDREIYASIQQKLAESYRAIHDWDKALNHYEIYSRMQDTLYAESSKRTIAEVEAKFQNKEKQQQIDNQEIELSYAKSQKLWFIAGLSLLSLVAILLWIIYRNKKRSADELDNKNKTLAELNIFLDEANQTKAKLFSIISHDLRSPISQVYQFLKLQQLNPNLLTEEKKAELSSKIQTATGSLLETMEDLLLWSKTQMNQFKPEFRKVNVLEIVSECLQLMQLNSEGKKIRFKNSVSSDFFLETDPYYLQTIVRNLLQNAIKAAPEGSEILIDFEVEVGKKYLSVTNSGGYFSQEQYEYLLVNKHSGKSLSGLGLHLVDELSRKVGAKVIFTETGNPDLTRVEVIC